MRDSYDNALAESVYSLYKAELIRRHRTWRTTQEVELATSASINPRAAQFRISCRSTSGARL
jgi:hypothetical protein